MAVIFSLGYTILAAYENNLCWPSAIIGVLLYIYICFEARLYSETGLQFFYLIMAFYGWWLWRNKKIPEEKLVISKLKLNHHLFFLVVSSLLTFLLFTVMKNYTNAALPLPDAFVTAFSLVATYLMTRKYIENWLWWIVVDGLAVYIYFNRGLYLSSVLYFIYVIIVVVAYFKWSKQYSEQNK